MATRIAEKAQRAFEFLMGMADPRVRRAMAGHGFTDADLDEGWSRLIALSKVPILVVAPPSVEVLKALDEWENRWFPISEVVLRVSHPRVHEVVFRNLRPTEGPQLIVSVKTWLDRLDAIALPEEEGGLGEEGERAREHLVRRGLTDEVLEQARALLAEMSRSPPVDEPIADPEDRAAAEARLWQWYLEWSGIARAIIKDSSALASLGFRRPGKKKKS